MLKRKELMTWKWSTRKAQASSRRLTHLTSKPCKLKKTRHSPTRFNLLLSSVLLFSSVTTRRHPRQTLKKAKLTTSICLPRNKRSKWSVTQSHPRHHPTPNRTQATTLPQMTTASLKTWKCPHLSSIGSSQANRRSKTIFKSAPMRAP